MRKYLRLTPFLFILILLISPYQLYSNTTEITSIIENLSIKSDDIPEGFTIGQVPESARTVFKNNPGFLDKNGIDKVTREIYSGGDKNKVSQIHVTILAKNGKVFGDDIVCYIISYKSNMSAKEEMNKFREYVKHHADRTVLISDDNIAIFILSNDIENFGYIRELGNKMQIRLNSLKNAKNTQNSVKK